MFRVHRPACLLLGGILLIAISPAWGAEEYTIDEMRGIASAGPATDSTSPENFDALESAIATAPEHRRQLVVWSADDPTTVVSSSSESSSRYVVNDEFEIYARLLETTDLGTLVTKIRVSVMGSDATTDAATRKMFAARNPAVSWNPISEEFLVVWEGVDDAAPLVAGESEIFAQRVDSSGKLVGSRFRVSIMGDDAEMDAAERVRFNASRPAVAVDPDTGDYLIVWQGDHDAAPLVDDEIEVFGRSYDSEGEPQGAQFRISFAGSDGDDRYAAERPRVAFNPVSDSFMVVWQADGDAGGLVDGENEIFLQQVSIDGPLPGGATRLSNMGPDGDAAFDALAPTVAIDDETGTVLVAWQGDTNTAPLVDEEFEIHGRRIDASGTALGDQFRISSMGADSAVAGVRINSQATEPRAAWSPSEEMFLVAWSGDTPEGDLADDEFEIFAAFVASDGTVPVNEVRVSVQGDDAQTNPTERAKYDASQPDVAFASGAFQIVWTGDHDASGSKDEQLQIFARRAAYTIAELELEILSSTSGSVAPAPIEIEFRLTNSGSSTAQNVRLLATLEDTFPLSWAGCAHVTDETLCEIGDIAAGAEATVMISLDTSDIEFGDDQGTNLTVQTLTDTALTEPSRANIATFVGTTVKVKGGNGALDLLTLLLFGLAGMPLALKRRRRYS